MQLITSSLISLFNLKFLLKKIFYSTNTIENMPIIIKLNSLTNIYYHNPNYDVLNVVDNTGLDILMQYLKVILL